MKIKIFKNISSTSLAVVFVFAQIIGVFGLTLESTLAASPAPNGPVKVVIVQYKDISGLPSADSPELNREVIRYQKNTLMQEQSLTSGYKKVVRNLKNLPVSIMEVDAEGEASLRASDKVASVQEREYIKPLLKDTIPLIGGNASTGFSDGSTNFTGTDQIIAIIDEGYNESHIMLDGSFAAEACFGQETTEYLNVTAESACPGGQTQSFAAGAAQANSAANNHGTAVAAVAVGRTISGGGNSYSGVAKGSQIVAIKAVIKVTEKAGYETCGDGMGTLSTCYLFSTDLVLAGLDYVIDLNTSNQLGKPIAAVNMSLGSVEDLPATRSACDSDNAAYVTSFANLRLANIAPVVAAGNSGDESGNADKISAPACVTGSVAVASSTRSDKLAYYSNSSNIVDILAPGGDGREVGDGGDGGIYTAPTGSNSVDTLEPTQGTSFAAPIISGAYAVMRQKNPTLSVATILRLFQETGVEVTEDRPEYAPTVHQRIKLDDALEAASGLPSITSLTTQGSSFVANQTFSISIVAPNAISCSHIGGTATANLSGGSGTISISAVAGTQTYVIECVDADGYAARQSLTVTAQGSSSVPPSDNTGQNGQVLGTSLKTPNTGLRRLLQQNPLITITVTILACSTIMYIVRRREQLLSK